MTECPVYSIIYFLIIIPVSHFRLIQHRITEWFRLEGTFKGHLVQPPRNEQGHLQLDQVTERPTPERFQGWDIYHLSGKPVLLFHHPEDVSAAAARS